MERHFPEILPTKGAGPARTATNLPFVEGISPSIQGLEKIIREIADSSVPVLLSGEVGTGKRVTAERIHKLSARRTGNFQAIACGGLVPECFSQAIQEDVL